MSLFSHYRNSAGQRPDSLCVGARVEDHLELHNIYFGPYNEYCDHSKSNKLSKIGYYSDFSCEHQPPDVIILTLLSVPESRGDTAWMSEALLKLLFDVRHPCLETASTPCQRSGLTSKNSTSSTARTSGSLSDGKRASWAFGITA